jgi:hypothetical protein
MKKISYFPTIIHPRKVEFTACFRKIQKYHKTLICFADLGAKFEFSKKIRKTKILYHFLSESQTKNSFCDLFENLDLLRKIDNSKFWKIPNDKNKIV